MHYKRIIFSICILSILILNSSCTSCSRSGRAKIIVMAQKEAAKDKTLPEPNTIIKNIKPETIKIEDIVSQDEQEIIKNDLRKNKIPPAVGKLIQVEGLVLKEVTVLTIKLETSDSQIEQILAMQNYIQVNWHYIFDPKTGSDTWRSAEATLSLKYQGKYSGDCDDFAILLASMARQIGLESRMVGGYDNNEGHAFAEFLVPEKYLSKVNLFELDYRKDYKGLWISLDWFKGTDHNRFTTDIKIFDDI